MPSAAEIVSQLLQRKQRAEEERAAVEAAAKAQQETEEEAQRETQKIAEEAVDDYVKRSYGILGSTQVERDLEDILNQFIPEGRISRHDRAIDGWGRLDSDPATITLQWGREREEWKEGSGWWGSGDTMTGYDEGYSYTVRRWYEIEVSAFDTGSLPAGLRVLYLDQMIDSGLVVKTFEGTFVKQSFVSVQAYERKDSDENGLLLSVIRRSIEPKFCRANSVHGKLPNLIAETFMEAIEFQKANGFGVPPTLKE